MQQLRSIYGDNDGLIYPVGVFDHLIDGGATRNEDDCSSSEDRPRSFDPRNQSIINQMDSMNANSVVDNKEHQSYGHVQSGGDILFSNPTIHQTGSAQVDLMAAAFAPGQFRYLLHTHGATDPRYISDTFSRGDILTINNLDVIGILATPDGSVYSIQPNLIDVSGMNQNEAMQAGRDNRVLIGCVTGE
ncbi:uncharacterized protein DUF4329 [Litorimonas taeanensis]|uniref:Uncharacterized protein DUF4329 n=1 Tax=Litorimonas taeanensis TaxID=568099 RepID=A0A420WLL7_9PROT|nr:DUF4329 domain-containing protein [Litorimonas taeanensis]RKQ71869.1 uncharacterized protein DUF4329 [Litorimonas taeanensis]